MSGLNLARIANGILIIVGLLFFKPLVWFVGIMMIFAGLTGFCLMEKVFSKLGAGGTCAAK